jgi:uncharacterized protein (TIGR00369 family)
MSSSTPTGAGDLLALMPHAQALGIDLVTVTAELTRGSLDWAAERCTAGNVLHGGVLMTLADSVGAICAHLNLPAGFGTTTIESKTNFFRAVRAGAVHAAARPLHVGRTVIVVQTNLTDDTGALVAQTTQTQAVITPKVGGAHGGERQPYAERAAQDGG